MTERYDQSAAAHYAAYRPPLHAPILRRALGDPGDGRTRCDMGVDIGSGTGASARALAAYSQRVYGVEPSASMRARALPHERIVYMRGASDAVPLPDGSADLVTFAGVLHYADSEATRTEVCRLCRAEARIVVYDFDLDVAAPLRALGIDLPANATDYDHRANFAGRAGFVEQTASRATVRLTMTPRELAHVVLSDSNPFDALARRYQTPGPFVPLVRDLEAAGPSVSVSATTYYAVYALAPPVRFM